MKKQPHRYIFPSEQERRKSLQELDGEDWGDGDYFPSHLVMTCHALRRKPLQNFTIEDLRIMIGQNLCLNYLVPLAIERLQVEPMASGDFYEGDLLASVMRVKASFWQEYSELYALVVQIVESVEPLPKMFRNEVATFRGNKVQG